MPEDFLDFLPLFPDQTEDVIRARWEIWANEGLDPAEDAASWTDTGEGTFFWVMTTPAIREDARQYDVMGTEVPAAASLIWTWGEYADSHGEAYDVRRLAGTPATGVETFSGPEGSVISAGASVEVPPTEDGEDGPEFQTTEEVVIPVSGSIDAAIVAVDPGVAGNVPAGAISEMVTPVAGVGVTNAAATVGGTDPETDDALISRIEAALRPRGGGNLADYESWTREVDGVGRVTVIPHFRGPGSVLVIVATAAGAQVSAAVLRAAQDFLDPPAFRTTLTVNVNLSTASSIEVASTAGVRANIANAGYLRIGGEMVSFTGFDADTFTGVADGTGSYLAGTEVLQGGLGHGRAPVGHDVLVLTISLLAVTLAATVEFEDGYSLDGDGGTFALRDALTLALSRYVSAVEPGGEVVLARVAGIISTMPGVHDVSAVTINGSAANLAVPGDPSPEAPYLSAAMLTEA